MSIEDIVKSRYRILPGRRSLSYQSRQGGGTWASAVTIIDCEKRHEKIAETTVDGMTAKRVTCTFHIWNDNTTLTPKQGDKFTDGLDSKVWIVDNSTAELLEERWRLECTRAIS